MASEIVERPDTIQDILLEYPHGVELPMSRGYISIIAWLESVGITEYDHYSFMYNMRPLITYYFRHESDAVLFTMKWS